MHSIRIPTIHTQQLPIGFGSPRLLYMLLLVLNVYAIYSFIMLAMRPEGLRTPKSPRIFVASRYAKSLAEVAFYMI